MTPHLQKEVKRKVLCLAALIAGDLLTLLAAFFSAYFLRATLLPVLIEFPRLLMPALDYLRRGFVPAAVILILMFFLEKLYSQRMPFWEEYRHLFRAVSLTFVLLTFMVFVTRSHTLYSRPVLFLSWLLGLAFFPISRAAVKSLLIKLRLWNKKVLILGIGPRARQVAQSLTDNRLLGYELAGFLSETGKDVGREIVPGGRVLGPISRVKAISRTQGVQDIIIALSSLGPQKLNRLTDRSEMLTENIRIVPDFGGLFTLGVEVNNWGRVLSLAVPRNLVKPWNILIKRSLEYVLTVVRGVLLLPVFLAISLAIKLDSKGPVIYKQRRLARNNRIFSLFKFRTMVVNNRALLQNHLRQNQEARVEWARYQKLRYRDPRVTAVGRFLRRFSLDELPQLINILRGEMSLVGPRPYLPREKRRIGRSLPLISLVKPGLTGLWQVSGRNRLTFDERLNLDEYYIRNWSLWLDLSILIRTIKTMAKGDGAY